jgi:hypothetical protein
MSKLIRVTAISLKSYNALATAGYVVAVTGKHCPRMETNMNKINLKPARRTQAPAYAPETGKVPTGTNDKDLSQDDGTLDPADLSDGETGLIIARFRLAAKAAA